MIKETLKNTLSKELLDSLIEKHSVSGRFISMHNFLDDFERHVLLASLENSKGNKSEAARSLCLARTTFVEKRKKYEI